jgi:hypothetical protein
LRPGLPIALGRIRFFEDEDEDEDDDEDENDYSENRKGEQEFAFLIKGSIKKNRV